ncbi:MAG: short-chain dehydrogenase, partial [Methylococcaceae bacterium]|nr:short-chain dehydrogenase [Methylococcaceae bacterium]
VLIEPGPIISDFRKNAFAQYQAHIDKTTSFHRATYEAMEARLNKEGPAAPFTLPATAVADAVIKALESKSPRYRYPVTFPTHLFAWLKRLLPASWLDRILLSIE